MKQLFHLVPRTFSIIAGTAYCTDLHYVKCVSSENNWSQVREVMFPLVCTEANVSTSTIAVQIQISVIYINIDGSDIISYNNFTYVLNEIVANLACLN